MDDILTLPEIPLSLAGVRFELHHPTTFCTTESFSTNGAHIHNEYEIYLNVSGNVSFLVNNRLYPVGPGDVIISRPGDVHVCFANADCFHEHFCLWLTAEEASPLLSVFAEGRHCLRADVGDGALARLFPLLEEAIAEGGSSLAATSVLLQILCALEAKETAIPAEKPHLPPEMQRILDHFNAYFTEIENVGDVLDTLHISYATLNRWFRKYIRLSPREFLEAKKLSHAKQLLQKGASVTEACLQSGFSDCSYFIAVFKKRFGETPGAMRQPKHSRRDAP